MNPAAILTAALAAAGVVASGVVRLPVPVVRQTPERCGPAALDMVFRYHGADSSARVEAGRAYDPVLAGSLITDLAAAARRAGFATTLEEPEPDSLVALLRHGVPPILLYRRGVGPVSVGHYGVVVGWDPDRSRFLVNDGGPRTRTLARDDLLRRWRAAGGLALVVRPGSR